MFHFGTFCLKSVHIHVQMQSQKVSKCRCPHCCEITTKTLLDTSLCKGLHHSSGDDRMGATRRSSTISTAPQVTGWSNRFCFLLQLRVPAHFAPPECPTQECRSLAHSNPRLGRFACCLLLILDQLIGV